MVRDREISLLALLIAVASTSVEGAAAKNQSHAADPVGSEFLSKEEDGEGALGYSTSCCDDHVRRRAGNFDLHEGRNGEEEAGDAGHGGGDEEGVGARTGDVLSEETVGGVQFTGERKQWDVSEDGHDVGHPDHLPHSFVALTEETLYDDRLDGGGETGADAEQDTLTACEHLAVVGSHARSKPPHDESASDERQGGVIWSWSEYQHRQQECEREKKASGDLVY